MGAGGFRRGEKRTDEVLAQEIRPGVVWVRSGHRPYTRTDAIAGVVALTLLELLVGFVILSTTSSRVYGFAAMAGMLLLILLSARFLLHRNLKRTKRMLRHARETVIRAIEGDPEVEDADLCAAVFAQRRAHTLDVSSVRVMDLEKLERRLSRRLPRVWMVTDQPVEVRSGFVPPEGEHKDTLASRRAGLPMYRQGEQIWPSSPVVPVGDQASASALVLWILGLLGIFALVTLNAPPLVLLVAIVGFVLISLAWMAQSNPAGYALAITGKTARLARRRVGSRLGTGREMCPEDTLVIIREAPPSVQLRREKGAPVELLWRFVHDDPTSRMPGAIEIPRFDCERSPWWWVADQSWEDGEQVEPNA